MASNAAAVPFWRAAGMTYITYSNICANLVRNCLKEPYRSEAISREKVHFSVSKWADGKPQKPTCLEVVVLNCDSARLVLGTESWNPVVFRIEWLTESKTSYHHNQDVNN
ncbi:ATP synthase, F1 complex, epsilon subunit, mitochondrial [Dillenia turbinata]|uniref:ATP synthase subunit epsilon, mitochondrial n=1 Tax=Dillenia turbinata TaxID=194707 RepID=A0AAN8YX58_9MAGN